MDGAKEVYKSGTPPSINLVRNWQKCCSQEKVLKSYCFHEAHTLFSKEGCIALYPDGLPKREPTGESI